jgi:hypothetical protein
MSDALTLADLSGAFQTVATLGFAMSVFKAPLLTMLSDTERRLDREEVLVRGRADNPGIERAGDLAKLRRDLNTARKSLVGQVAGAEWAIWIASLASAAMLIWASLKPSTPVSQALAIALMLVPVAVVALATAIIWKLAHRSLSPIDEALRRC